MGYWLWNRFRYPTRNLAGAIGCAGVLSWGRLPNFWLRAQGMAGMSDFDVSITDFIQRFCLRAMLMLLLVGYCLLFLETICPGFAALFGRLR